MDSTTALNATNHFRDNHDSYQSIRARLSSTRQLFEQSEINKRVNMLQLSHAFAVLSVQTPVAIHERAFDKLFPDGHFPTSESDIRNRISEVNYYNNKASYIWDSLNRGSDWVTVIQMLDNGDVDIAHKYILDSFKGVGPAKAPFVLAMLGFTEKMCIDTNIMNVVGIDRPNTVVVDKYESIVDDVRSRFPALSRETGSPFLFQWALFDYQRGDISFHDVFFKKVGVMDG